MPCSHHLGSISITYIRSLVLHTILMASQHQRAHSRHLRERSALEGCWSHKLHFLWREAESTKVDELTARGYNWGPSPSKPFVLESWRPKASYVDHLIHLVTNISSTSWAPANSITMEYCRSLDRWMRFYGVLVWTRIRKKLRFLISLA